MINTGPQAYPQRHLDIPQQNNNQRQLSGQRVIQLQAPELPQNRFQRIQANTNPDYQYNNGPFQKQIQQRDFSPISTRRIKPNSQMQYKNNNQQQQNPRIPSPTSKREIPNLKINTSQTQRMNQLSFHQKSEYSNQQQQYNTHHSQQYLIPQPQQSQQSQQSQQTFNRQTPFQQVQGQQYYIPDQVAQQQIRQIIIQKPQQTPQSQGPIHPTNNQYQQQPMFQHNPQKPSFQLQIASQQQIQASNQTSPMIQINLLNRFPKDYPQDYLKDYPKDFPKDFPNRPISPGRRLDKTDDPPQQNYFQFEMTDEAKLNKLKNQVPIDRQLKQEIEQKQSFLTYELRFPEENNIHIDDLSIIQDPDTTEFMKYLNNQSFNIIVLHNQKEYEHIVELDRLPNNWKVIDLIRYALNVSQVSLKKPQMSVMLGKAAKTLISPQMTLVDIMKIYPEKQTLLIEEFL